MVVASASRAITFSSSAGLGGPDQGAEEERWDSHSQAPTVRLHFHDERVTPAVLTFLRGARVGTLAPPEEEWEECTFPLFTSSVILLAKFREKGAW